MEDVTVNFDLIDTDTPDPITLAILPVDDADIYVESAHFYFGVKASNTTSNKVFFEVKRGDNDGNLGNSVALASGGVMDSNLKAAKTWHDMGIDQNQVVEKGKVLYLNVDPQGTMTSVVVAAVSVNVRYRRKA
jgi:hypothetical protein